MNVTTTAAQRTPSIDVDADGDFVVVWESYDPQSYIYNVFARRFSSAGAAQGGEFRVNAPNGARNPAVALDATGGFVVVWNAFDGSGNGVFGRRFNSAGTAQAAEFKANDFTIGSQVQPALDLDANGDFVVAWQSPDQDGSQAGVFARRFTSAGVPQATEFQANSYVTGYQAGPAVALDPDGDFVVAWSSQQDGGSFGIFGRRWNSAGAPQAAEFQVNVYTTDLQLGPSVDISASGEFVVSWSSKSQDGSDYGVFARRFTSNGTALGGELQVNVYTSLLQRDAVVSMESDGDFVVTWNSSAVDGSSTGISIRRFRANGTPKTSELQANSYVTGTQGLPSVGVTDGGSFVVAWASLNQDGDNYGVFARRFSTLTLDFDGDGTTGPLTDGLLLLRYFFGFSGSALTSGAVGGACTRCTADAIQPQLNLALSPQGPPLRTGVEFQVSSFTMYAQRSPGAGMSDDGAFVIVWQDRDIDGQGIFVRRFDANGSAQSVQFRANALTAGDQTEPAVGQGANGSFVVVWQHQPYSVTSLVGRRFDSGGVPLPQDSSEFFVNGSGGSGASFVFGDPAIATNTLDHFVVTWTDDYNVGGYIEAGVFARRVFDPQIQVNTYTTGSQILTDVAMDGQGGFVVVWASSHQEGESMNRYGIFGRRYSSAGAALGTEFQVNSYTPFSQVPAAVAMSNAGDFVVVWENHGSTGWTNGIFARRFHGAGAPDGSQFQVNSSPAAVYESGGYPDAAMSDDGAFVVVWDQGGDVFARWFGNNGIPQGEDVLVNTYTTGGQFRPEVAADADGDLVVVWSSDDQDGSDLGVFAQRFTRRALFDVDGDGSLGPLTDGLLILRYLFGFTGASLINGVVDPDCTRCTAPAIELYIASLL